MSGGRRDLLRFTGGVGAAWMLGATPAFAQRVPPDQHLRFKLMREGDKIGEEVVRFDTVGERLTVTIEADIRVSVAFVTVYSLHHHETETWQDGRLLAFAATTRKNGRDFYAQGWRVDDAFMVRGSAVPAAYRAPDTALPTSQWNHAMLQGPMINTQDGRLMHPTVYNLGMADIRLADGAQIPARHYKAQGDLHFDTFFTPSWEWVGLSFRAKDGSLITYELV